MSFFLFVSFSISPTLRIILLLQPSQHKDFRYNFTQIQAQLQQQHQQQQEQQQNVAFSQEPLETARLLPHNAQPINSIYLPI